MSLWPSNQSQTFSVGGFTKLARRTQVTGFLSYGLWTNDSTLQPFTINPALPTLPLPRQETDAEAHVFSTNLGVVSRPCNDLRLSARLRVYDFANETPHADIPQFVSYDSSVSTSLTGGPELYAHSRQTFTADATWTGLAPLALGVGYTHNRSGYDFRIFENTSEDVLTLTADAVGLLARKRAGTARIRRSHRLRPRRSAPRADRRAAGAAALRPREPIPQEVHRHLRLRSSTTNGSLSASAGFGTGRLRRQLLRPAGIVVPNLRCRR